MKKKGMILLCAALAAVLLGACGAKLEVEKNTIALQKNGKVLEASVEDFSQSYYNEEELNAYVQEAVDSFAQEHGDKAVTVSESKVEEQKAYLTLNYEDCQAYADFTGMDCFSGTVLEAQTAGYDFDDDFYAVTDGAAAEETVSAAEAVADDELKVFIVKGNSDIIVPGKIAYVSATGTAVASEDTVTVQEKKADTDESYLVYVVYR